MSDIRLGVNAALELFVQSSGQLLNNRYRMGRLIGAGAFAKVLLGTDKQTGERVAIKLVIKSMPQCDMQRAGVPPGADKEIRGHVPLVVVRRPVTTCRLSL